MQIFGALSASLALLLTAAGAAAQSYPSKPIRMVVPLTPDRKSVV